MVTRKDNKEKINDFISKCKTSYIELNEYNKKRSARQNDLYWSILSKVCAFSDGSYTKSELHEIMKDMLLPKKMIEFNGLLRWVAKSTTDLTSSEFSEYLELVVLECSKVVPYDELNMFEDYGL